MGYKTILACLCLLVISWVYVGCSENNAASEAIKPVHYGIVNARIDCLKSEYIRTCGYRLSECDNGYTVDCAINVISWTE